MGRHGLGGGGWRRAWDLVASQSWSPVVSAASFTVARAETRGVIELFTSQGCSSCPAADKLMGELAKDPTLVSISLPINYWDYLGWKDTLADPRNTARQRGYSKVRGDREVYTPQVVVNGSMHVVGSDRGAIEKAIEQEPAEAGHALAAGDAQDGRWRADCRRAGWRGRARRGGSVDLRSLQRPSPSRSSAARTAARPSPITTWCAAGSSSSGWNGKAHTWTVPLHDVGGEGIDGAAVMVQTGTTERPSTILGAPMAASLRLTRSA